MTSPIAFIISPRICIIRGESGCPPIKARAGHSDSPMTQTAELPGNRKSRLEGAIGVFPLAMRGSNLGLEVPRLDQVVSRECVANSCDSERTTAPGGSLLERRVLLRLGTSRRVTSTGAHESRADWRCSLGHNALTPSASR